MSTLALGRIRRYANIGFIMMSPKLVPRNDRKFALCGFHVVDVAAVVVGGARGAAGFATDRHEAIQFSTPQWSPAASVLLTALAQASAA